MSHGHAALLYEVRKHHPVRIEGSPPSPQAFLTNSHVTLPHAGPLGHRNSQVYQSLGWHKVTRLCPTCTDASPWLHTMHQLCEEKTSVCILKCRPRETTPLLAPPTNRVLLMALRWQDKISTAAFASDQCTQQLPTQAVPRWWSLVTLSQVWPVPVCLAARRELLMEDWDLAVHETLMNTTTFSTQVFYALRRKLDG